MAAGIVKGIDTAVVAVDQQNRLIRVFPEQDRLKYRTNKWAIVSGSPHEYELPDLKIWRTADLSL
jgi:hypothetical protein